MKKLFTIILFAFLSLGIAKFAYADESDSRKYIFVTSCGKVGEIIIEGVLTPEEEDQIWQAFDDILCSDNNNSGSTGDIMP